MDHKWGDRQTAIRTAVAYAGERHSFGLPLLDHQGLRWSLVDVATDLEAGRLLTLQAPRQWLMAGTHRSMLRLPRSSRPKWLPEASCLHASGGSSGAPSALWFRPSPDVGAHRGLCRRHDGDAKRTYWGRLIETLWASPVKIVLTRGVSANRPTFLVHRFVETNPMRGIHFSRCRL